jgi:hypothetical protein
MVVAPVLSVEDELDAVVHALTELSNIVTAFAWANGATASASTLKVRVFSIYFSDGFTCSDALSTATFDGKRARVIATSAAMAIEAETIGIELLAVTVGTQACYIRQSVYYLLPTSLRRGRAAVSSSASLIFCASE